uniref:Secreted protein n=1 Tax=Trichuris muris TaxID=70415 RepID=A0A5S6Q924_TRIMR
MKAVVILLSIFIGVLYCRHTAEETKSEESENSHEITPPRHERKITQPRNRRSAAKFQKDVAFGSKQRKPAQHYSQKYRQQRVSRLNRKSPSRRAFMK